MAANPNDEPLQFVRQHYHDFLNRQPDDEGLRFWAQEIESCGSDAQCRQVKRVNVSAAFFLSIELQETGFLAYRLHQAAFGAGPLLPFHDFLQDAQEVGRGVVVGEAGWEQRLEGNKAAFSERFAGRQAFLGRYPAAMTAAQFVDALNRNAGGALSQAERDDLVGKVQSGTLTRGQALRAVVDDGELRRREFDRAFVYMQYVGYLRRAPADRPDSDLSGFNFWLGKLSQFGGNFIQAEMVRAFIESVEYRGRFGGCPAGGQVQFTAEVRGVSNTAVMWSLPGGGGQITQAGLFTAGAVEGAFVVRATSVADTTKIDDATVQVAAQQGGVTPSSRSTLLVSHAALAQVGTLDSFVEVADQRFVNSFAPYDDLVNAGLSRYSATLTNTARQVSRFGFGADGKQVISVEFDGSASSSSSGAGTGIVFTADSASRLSFEFRVEDRPVGYRVEGSLDAGAANAGGELNQFTKGQARLYLRVDGGPFVFDRLVTVATDQTNRTPAPQHLPISEMGVLAPGRYTLFVELLIDGQASHNGVDQSSSGSASGRGLIKMTFGPTP